MSIVETSTAGHLEEPTSQEQGKIGHERHQKCREAGEKEDGGHEAELELAAREILGEDVAGEDAADEEAREAESPNQVDC